MGDERRRAPIGIVVKTYPKLSETFILEELLGLEEAGLALELFSLQRPTDDRTNPETYELAAPVHYPPRRWSIVRDHVRLARRHPIRYLRSLGATVRRGRPHWVRDYLTAGWLAARAGQTGVGHLHAHFLSAPTSVAQIASQLAGVEFSASGHAKDIYLTPDDELAEKLQAARFTVTCTQHNRDHLATIAGPDADVACVHHGVRLDRFSPSSTPADPPVILAVGRLRAKKGFDVLLQACARLEAAGESFECRIVGYGPEEEALRADIGELGLTERVELLGKLTRDEVIAEYARATMLVQPCRVIEDGDRDGIPNVLLEAMAMELPVISTTVSGIPELVRDGDNGVLVPPDDVEALTEAIAVLLGDGRLRRILGSRARATVNASFTSERSAATIAAKLDRPRIAYIVKGYPRLSELFIATEIHRVERLGLPLRLFVVKPADEDARHQVVNETVAEPEYLPPLSSISGQAAGPWLQHNFGSFRRPMIRVALASPIGFATAARRALAQSWRARRGRRLRKVYLKEFLQAVAVADAVLADPMIAHLHAHFCHGSTTIAWLAATMSGRTFSFTAHAKDIYRADLNPAGLLNRKLLAAEFVATCTDANRAHLTEIEPSAAVHTIYHGLNEDFTRLVQRPAARRAPSTEAFTVLAVARLVPKKGIDLLLEATASLVEMGLDVEVRIVGEEGEHGPELRGLTDALRLRDRVGFLGAMDQRQLFAEYRRADVFCLPCRITEDGDRDGIPNVLVEAMAAGLPVVTTPISGIPELVEHRRNGLLVTAGSSAAVAKALLELHDDPELRQALADSALATIESDFDGWETTRQLVGLFRQTLDIGQRR